MTKGLKLFLTILGALTLIYAIYGAFTGADMGEVAGGVAIGGGLLSVNFLNKESEKKSE